MIGTTDIRDQRHESAPSSIAQPEAQRYTTVCAWCSRIVDEDGNWVYSMRDMSKPATHGICPACLEVMKEELHQYSLLHSAPQAA